MRRILSILLCLSALVLITGCRQSVSADWNAGAADADFAAAQALSQDVSVHEKGVFFLDGGLLNYYDYESDQSFVLCSKPNCTHAGKDCVAHAGSDARGFAMYGDYAYYFRPVEDSLCWELVKVDIQNQTSTVVATLGNPQAELDAWSISEVQSVYYSSGYAWVKLKMLLNPSEPTGWTDSGSQMIGVDLASGQIHTLTEPLMDNRDCTSIFWFCFGDGRAAYVQMRYDPVYMTQQEFDRSDKAASQSYSEYLSEYTEQHPTLNSCWVIDTADMTPTCVTESQETDLPAWFSNGQLVMLCLNSDAKEESYLPVNADGTYGQSLFTIPNGGALGWYHGEAGLRLYNGDSLLYLTYIDPDRCNIYLHNLETGENTFLFEDDAGVSFRIVGQTSDKLVGMVNESSQFAWIYKADYEAGKMDAMHKFSLLS